MRCVRYSNLEHSQEPQVGTRRFGCCGLGVLFRAHPIFPRGCPSPLLGRAPLAARRCHSHRVDRPLGQICWPPVWPRSPRHYRPDLPIARQFSNCIRGHVSGGRKGGGDHSFHPGRRPASDAGDRRTCRVRRPAWQVGRRGPGSGVGGCDPGSYHGFRCDDRRGGGFGASCLVIGERPTLAGSIGALVLLIGMGLVLWETGHDDRRTRSRDLPTSPD